jgi:hypothetical protein
MIETYTIKKPQREIEIERERERLHRVGEEQGGERRGP